MLMFDYRIHVLCMCGFFVATYFIVGI